VRSEYVYSAAGSTRPDGDRIYGEVLKRLAGLAAGATVLDAGLATAI
jgi:hypothetical protein